MWLRVVPEYGISEVSNHMIEFWHWSSRSRAQGTQNPAWERQRVFFCRGGWHYSCSTDEFLTMLLFPNDSMLTWFEYEEIKFRGIVSGYPTGNLLPKNWVVCGYWMALLCQWRWATLNYRYYILFLDIHKKQLVHTSLRMTWIRHKMPTSVYLTMLLLGLQSFTRILGDS